MHALRALLTLLDDIWRDITGQPPTAMDEDAWLFEDESTWQSVAPNINAPDAGPDPWLPPTETANDSA